MHERLSALVLGLCALAAQGATQVSPTFKQLAGPPEEFSEVRPVAPEQTAVESRSAVLPLELRREADGLWRSRVTLPVERGGARFAIVEGGPAGPRSWRVALRDPLETRSRSVDALQAGTSSFDAGSEKVPARIYEIDDGRSGPRELILESQTAGRGAVVIEGRGAVRLLSRQVAFDQLLGRRIGIVARLVERPRGPHTAAAVVTTATLSVTTPDSRDLTIDMADDGRHSDGAPNDGTYGGEFLADCAGTFGVRVVVWGLDASGEEFVRTVQHLVPVVDDDLRLNDAPVQAHSVGEHRLYIPLAVSPRRAGDHYRVIAEVWGHGANGEEKAIAWIGGMTALESEALMIGLDTRWIALAEAHGPFELRRVRIEDPNYFVTVASADRIPLIVPLISNAASPQSIVIGEEMTMGPRPASLRPPLTPASDAYTSGTGHKLLLVHGYCSANVWGPVASQFTNSAVFQDLGQNRTIDDFAQRLLAFGNTWNSYAIVAHSQGGMAALHLAANYWSGLDNLGTGRAIQTVGTPFLGTPLAANAAVLGQLFGASCGPNANLTYAGAEAWLAGIPSSKRAKVYFHTTAFTQTSLTVWDYCNQITDLLLTDPDDGIIEREKGKLAGAVDRGHVEGQCHVAGMRDPAQTADSSRNATMSGNAAAGPPVLTTNPATSVTSTSAVLNGSVAPSAGSTSTRFEYGPTTSYGQTVNAQTRTGTASQTISAALSALACGTTYHFRAAGSNSAGTRYGLDRTFATPACSCTSYTLSASAATNVTSAAGSQQVTVTGSPAGCNGTWSATTTDSWLSANPTSGNSGSTTTVSWASNASVGRSGSISIGGSTFAVSQPAGSGCGWVLQPTSANAAAAAGSQQVTVALPLGCASIGTWSATTNATWLSVTPQTGYAGEKATVAWTANGGAARQGSVTIGAMVFPVAQTASPTAFTAIYDSSLKVPKCASTGTSCDSGTLLQGRATLGPEPNAPNTIGSACADGTSGIYHVDESLDRLTVASVDGTLFAQGKTVRIEAVVWAYGSTDRLDLYYASDAATPVWTLVGTYQPAGVGSQKITATFVLPAGALQAVRGNFRFGGSTSTCSSSAYDDHDDLVFAVGAAPAITVSPTSGLTTTEAGGTATFSVVLTAPPTSNVTIALRSSDLGEGTVSVSSLLFTPSNWNTPQVVTVRGVDDDLVDGTVAYTIICDPAVSSDARYDGVNAPDVSVQNTDDDVAPPASVVATASGASLTVTWSAVPGVSSYQVEVVASPLSQGIQNTASTTFAAPFSGPLPACVRVRVRAVAGGGYTSWSVPDVACAMTYSDDPLAGTHKVRAVHINEVRACVGALRTLAGLGSYAFTGTIAAGGVVRAVHVTELRSALSQARAVLQVPSVTFTDPSLTSGWVIKRAHVQELRNAMR